MTLVRAAAGPLRRQLHGDGGDERGQAIVLIAIALAAVVGMSALAIDGGRAYSVRRDLQAAVDAAALAAGDYLQQTGSYSGAEQAATSIFGTNLRLYAAPSCTPAYGAPGATPLTVTCTYADGTALTEVISALGPQGTQFSLTATRLFALQFAQILTSAPAPKLAATSSSGVNNLLFSPTIAALSQDGCGGSAGAAISVNSGGTLSVTGDVVSNGAISSTGSTQVAGDIYARCQSVVPNVTTTCYPSGSATPCTYPDVAGVMRSGYRFVDPGYPPPGVVGGSQGAPGTDVVMFPGLYASNPGFSSSVCYFLSAGVYEWQAGYTNAGGFVSNELKPPDEPNATNNTALGNQMWNTGGVNCAGAYRVSAIAGANAITRGTWGFEVTSTRTDSYAGTIYKRESAPSICRTVSIDVGQVIQVQISNVPGATAYNVYFDPPPNACAGPFGFGGSVLVAPVRVQNNATASCPAFSGTSCSLGYETAVFDSTVLGSTFAPNPFVAPGVIGAYPPVARRRPSGSTFRTRTLTAQRRPRATERTRTNATRAVGSPPTARSPPSAGRARPAAMARSGCRPGTARLPRATWSWPPTATPGR